MPDVVRGGKIKDFCYWAEIKDPQLKAEALLIAWKEPETERKSIAAELDPKHVGAEYTKELEGNVWKNIIITPQHGILPMDVWHKTVANAITSVSGNPVTITNVSSPVFVASGANPSPYLCPHCSNPIFMTPSSGTCPTCQRKFAI